MPNATIATKCCIVGGGPAGMMLGYLLGRAGVDVVVLEKHADFFRDFRGDTVHPSTLAGDGRTRADRRFPETAASARASGWRRMFGGETVRIADLAPCRRNCQFIASCRSGTFSISCATAASAIRLSLCDDATEAIDLIEEGERVVGRQAKTPDGDCRYRADLSIGCDGRHSMVRERAGLEVEDIGAPMDVLWFRAAQARATTPRTCRPRRSRQDDGDARPRRLLAVRLS